MSSVSIIIPAYNAADTLDEALASVCAQTMTAWEAVVVDDGSTDETARLAEHWIERDSRISLIRQPNGGQQAARNTGIRAAQHEWLAFLDADDWLAPNYLKCMLRPVARNDRLDGVVCGVVHLTEDGDQGPPCFPPLRDELFPYAATECPWTMNAVLVRRSLVEAVGLFDPNLKTSEDWDLWQRYVRTTSRFAVVNEALAFVRMRPRSLSRADTAQLLADELLVLQRSHSRDPRVPNPDPRWAAGLPRENLPGVMYEHAASIAGADLAQGGDGIRLLTQVPVDRAPDLDPDAIAGMLYSAVPYTTCQLPRDWWPEQWPILVPRLQSFLAALEQRSGTPALARRTLLRLEERVLSGADLREPIALSMSHGVRVDVMQPIADVTTPPHVERLVCKVEIGGRQAGAVILPVFGNTVAGRSIAEAIAEERAAPVAREYLRLRVKRDPRVWVRLARLVLSRRTLRFVINYIQVSAPSRIERLHAFLWMTARQVLPRWGLARAEATAGAAADAVLPRIRVEFRDGTRAGRPNSEAAPAPEAVEPPRREVTDRLPILMYHRVAPDGTGEFDRYRITPEQFEQQLGYLRDQGYYGIHLKHWRRATADGRGLPGRAVLITFDDGYQDFLIHAWPLLQRYDFRAMMFVVTGLAGGRPTWYRSYGEPAPLMSWSEIRRLADEGVAFGSHTVDHPFLTGLPPKDMAYQGVISRETLEQQLGREITAIAYPYGDYDALVRRVMGELGYEFGLTTDGGCCRIFSPRMALPRVEVAGSDDLEEFAAKLESAYRCS